MSMTSTTIADLSLFIDAEASPALKLDYQDTPLPVQSWIRILVLRPGLRDERLSCNLVAQTIEHAAVSGFEALSYVWGIGEDAAVEMDCDGYVIFIRQNLACALKHIRLENETRYLWVDAVCIDQANVEERSEQVRQMGEIYTSADRVLIWIGPDQNHEAQQCFDLVQDTTTTLGGLMAKHGDVSLIPSITPQSGLICSDARKWEAVQRLMNTEWFNRVWVLQEIGLARSAIVLYGNCSMNWAYLVELMLIAASRVDILSQVGNIKSGMIWDFHEDLWRSYGNVESWRNELPMTRSLTDTSDGGSFINILNDGRGYDATDHRDRVYAFLSHPSASCGPAREGRLVVADYHLSVDQVYLDTARRILENDANPWTVLSCVDHASASFSLSGQRPSWVPRWDESWRVYWLGYPEMWYRAGGEGSAELQYEVSDKDSWLKSTGVLLDSISWTSRAFDSDELRLEPQKENSPVQRLWAEVQRHDLGDSIYGPKTEDREYAFSLAIAAGRATDDGPAGDHQEHHLAVYKQYKAIVGNSSLSQQTPPSTEPKDPKTRRKEHDPKALELEALTYLGSSQRRALHNRRFFRTNKGYYGVGHREIEVGDVSCVLRGANIPFVLRKERVDSETLATADRVADRFRLVGEAFIQGVMRGELFRGASGENKNDLREETIVIV